MHHAHGWLQSMDSWSLKTNQAWLREALLRSKIAWTPKSDCVDLCSAKRKVIQSVFASPRPASESHQHFHKYKVTNLHSHYICRLLCVTNKPWVICPGNTWISFHNAGSVILKKSFCCLLKRLCQKNTARYFQRKVPAALLPHATSLPLCFNQNKGPTTVKVSYKTSNTAYGEGSYLQCLIISTWPPTSRNGHWL